MGCMGHGLYEIATLHDRSSQRATIAALHKENHYDAVYLNVSTALMLPVAKAARSAGIAHVVVHAHAAGVGRGVVAAADGLRCGKCRLPPCASTYRLAAHCVFSGCCTLAFRRGRVARGHGACGAQPRRCACLCVRFRSAKPRARRAWRGGAFRRGERDGHEARQEPRCS